jgi:serum/glucocorticoid-regulated kinase 1/serum/glucocorticoid-regulated kinase 2
MIGKQAFEVMYPVGKGGFGKVWKVRCRRTGEVFAMKEMQKIKIINKKSITSVMNERVLLADL